MDYKITKLDRRYNGYYMYEYFVEPWARDRLEAAQQLIALRNWCWETYGSSAELEYTKRGDTWAWESTYDKKRIYLKSSKELMLFKLRWT